MYKFTDKKGEKKCFEVGIHMLRIVVDTSDVCVKLQSFRSWTMITKDS